MNVVAPLVDTLQALKRLSDIAGPGAIPGAGKVVNDVRLPSRAALQQLLGADLGGAHELTQARLASRFGEATTLSVAARAISAILGAAPDDVAGVRGASPVWAAATTPQPAQLAGALARVVATSGLFYESHLQQFAAGTRPLMLLAQEPQARLGPLASTRPELFTPVQGNGAEWLNPAAKNVVTLTAAMVSALAAAASSAEAGEAASAVPATAGQTPQSPATAGSQSVRTGGMPELQAVPEGPRPGPAGRVEAAYGALRAADGAAPMGTAGKAGGPEGLDDAPVQQSRSTASGLARHGESAGNTIHPEAVSLVRQQLDVLAMPVFRWNGEMWPGVPMQWDIREEQAPGDMPAGAEADSAPRSWSTRLAIKLPRLGEVEVRLSLAGATLQLQLGAREAATVGLLGEGGKALPARLGDLGLQLAGLQVGALPALAPAPQQEQKDAHAS